MWRWPSVSDMDVEGDAGRAGADGVSRLDDPAAQAQAQAHAQAHVQAHAHVQVRAPRLELVEDDSHLDFGDALVASGGDGAERRRHEVHAQVPLRPPPLPGWREDVGLDVRGGAAARRS